MDSGPIRSGLAAALSSALVALELVSLKDDELEFELEPLPAGLIVFVAMLLLLLTLLILWESF